MEEDLSILEILGRLLAALVGGAALGWEREARRKPAGLKTHILVTLGTAGFSLIAMDLMRNLRVHGASMAADPLRILHGVATGVGFLGAGAIMRAEGQVHGLTTAAGIWVAAAVGAAIGFGAYLIAAGLVVFALLTLTAMRTPQTRIHQARETNERTGSPASGTEERSDAAGPSFKKRRARRGPSGDR